MAKEVNKRVTICVNGKEVENNVKSIRAEMLKLTNQLNKTTIGSEVLPPSFFHNIKTETKQPAFGRPAGIYAFSAVIGTY